MSIITKIKLLAARSRDGGVRSGAIIIASMMFLSQVVGLIRDRLFAANIGPGPLLDSYYAAFKIPDLFFTIGGTLVSVTVLLPLLTARMGSTEDPDKSAGSRFLGMIAKVYGIFFIVVFGILMLVMPLLVRALYPGFDANMTHMTVNMARIMMLSPIFFITGNLLATVTQYQKRFLTYALSPVLYNAGIVFGIAVLYPLMGAAGLAVGVIVGAFTQILLHAPVAYRARIFPELTRARVRWSEIKPVLSISLPRTIGLVATQVSSIALSSFASLFGPASISRLQLSFVLVNAPLALLGTSYATAMFPDITRFAQSGENEKLHRAIIRAISDIVLIAVPVMTVGIVLKTYAIRVLFGGGAFDTENVLIVSTLLSILLISFPFLALDAVALRIYFAFGEAMRPMMRNVTMTAITIGIAFGLVQLAQAGNPFVMNLLHTIAPAIEHPQVLVLAIAYSLSGVISLVVLWLPLLRGRLRPIVGRILMTALLGVVSGIIAGIISWVVRSGMESVFVADTTINILLIAGVAGIAGFAVLVAGMVMGKRLV